MTRNWSMMLKQPPFIYPLRTSFARSQRIKHALSSRTCCAVNYRVELNGNAITRHGSSVETPRSPTGRRDIFILLKNNINLYNLSKFPCDHTAIKEILHRRANSVWMQPGVTFPLTKSQFYDSIEMKIITCALRRSAIIISRGDNCLFLAWSFTADTSMNFSISLSY